MLGNKVFGPGTFTVDVFKLPEDEFPIIVEIIQQRCEAIKSETMKAAQTDPAIRKMAQDAAQVSMHELMDRQARDKTEMNKGK